MNAGATRHQNEQARLETLRHYDILDTPADGAFDRVAALAARYFDVPIATVSIVDHDRIWFKATHGIDLTEITRHPGLCASVILQDESYVVTDALQDPRTLENPLVRGELGLRFYAAAPIQTADGHNLGTVNVIDVAPREVTDDERATLQDLAAVVADQLDLRREAQRAVEVERADKREAERVTEMLQKRLLPQRIPQVARVELATHYHPLFPVVAAGGDFLDVFDLDGGLWALAVGDVSGKGPEAAAVTGEIRHMLRALARVHTRPREVLAALNDVLHRAGLDEEGSEERFCTGCYVLLDTGKDPVEATLCAAGHPLPLVRRADGRVEERGRPGQPLGLFAGVELSEETVRLATDDMLLLYTDGAVEQRHTPLLEGEQALADALQRASTTEAGQTLDRLLAAIGHESRSMTDDVAMLLARVTA